MQYIIKGRAIKKTKETIVVGFWKWKKEKDVVVNTNLFEFSIRAASAQSAIKFLMSFDNRVSGIVMDSVEEICK